MTTVSAADDAKLRFHLRSLRGSLRALRAGGRAEPRVLALLVVESLLRPRVQRLGEYLLWWGLGARLGFRRRELLSVGISQVQLRHWRALGALPSTRFSAASLRTVLSAEANYDVCLAYLERWADWDEDPPLGDLVRAYTGGRSSRYLGLLERALVLLDPISREGPRR